MEQLINEIAAYAAGKGIKPATVLQKAGGLGGHVWAKWVARTASCTLPMADRLRAYMAANPVKSVQPEVDTSTAVPPEQDAA